LDKLVRLIFAEDAVKNFLDENIIDAINQETARNVVARQEAEINGCGLLILVYENETFYYLDFGDKDKTVRTQYFGGAS
jgi:hypothetical protein